MKRIELAGTERLWGDERGWGLRLLEAAGLDPARIGDFHMVSVEPGAVRGNHRHPRTTEWMLVFGGPARVAGQTPGGPVEVAEVAGDAPVLLEFGPGVAHAVTASGQATVFLACFADGVPETERVDPLL